MNIERKTELVRSAIDSIATHDDAPLAERRAAIKAVIALANRALVAAKERAERKATRKARA